MSDWKEAMSYNTEILERMERHDKDKKPLLDENGLKKALSLKPASGEPPLQTWQKVVKMIIMSLAVGGAGYQVVVIMGLFFHYPTNVVVAVETTPYLELPGITICSSVR